MYSPFTTCQSRLSIPENKLFVAYMARVFVWALGNCEKVPPISFIKLAIPPTLTKPAKTVSMFSLQTGDNETCVWDPDLNLFILIRDQKCYNLSPRASAHSDHRANKRLQLVSHLIELSTKLREAESQESRDLSFSDPDTTRRAIRTVLIEKEAEDRRAVEKVIDDVFMRKIMVYFH